ncbi:MAG: class I SAM-dependent rRNA methyltransferase, partial [Shewanella sp.]
MSIQTLLSTALAKRHGFFLQAEQDHTDCFRVFHGTVEGVSGLNVDRYGDTWLVQSFHQTLTVEELAEIAAVLTQEVDLPVV